MSTEKQMQPWASSTDVRLADPETSIRSGSRGGRDPPSSSRGNTVHNQTGPPCCPSCGVALPPSILGGQLARSSSLSSMISSMFSPGSSMRGGSLRAGSLLNFVQNTTSGAPGHKYEAVGDEGGAGTDVNDIDERCSVHPSLTCIEDDDLPPGAGALHFVAPVRCAEDTTGTRLCRSEPLTFQRGRTLTRPRHVSLHHPSAQTRRALTSSPPARRGAAQGLGLFRASPRRRQTRRPRRRGAGSRSTYEKPEGSPESGRRRGTPSRRAFGVSSVWQPHAEQPHLSPSSSPCLEMRFAHACACCSPPVVRRCFRPQAHSSELPP